MGTNPRLRLLYLLLTKISILSIRPGKIRRKSCTKPSENAIQSNRSSDRGAPPKEEKTPRPEYGQVFQLWQKRSLCQYLSRLAKKLVSILATSSSVTEASKEKYVSLERMACIHYLLRFWKDTIGVKALIDSGNEVNAMTPVYAASRSTTPTSELKRLMVLPSKYLKWSWLTSK